jgi:hypothetical protein
MPIAEALIEIGRAPTEVFVLLDDIARAAEWLESCRAIQQTSPGPKGVGTTLELSYQQGSRPGTMEGFITAYELGNRLGMQFSNRQVVVEYDFELRPVAGGTQVRHTCRITPLSFIRWLVSPLTQVGNRWQVGQNLSRLKCLLEAGPATPAGA